MHELVVTKQLLTQVLQYAKANEVLKVTAIHLKVGALRGIVDEWLRRYFAYASQDTLAQGAQLQIQRIPGSVVCPCGVITPIELGHLDEAACQECGNRQTLRLWSGQEFILEGIEVLERKGQSDG